MITVDTHVILWHALKPEKLSNHAKQAIERANSLDGIFFCEISLWEIAMLMEKKRIQVNTGYQDFVDLVLSSNKYVLQGLTPQIADLSVNLPPEVNNDPADRMITATSIIFNAPLITADKNLIKADCVETIW